MQLINQTLALRLFHPKCATPTWNVGAGFIRRHPIIPTNYYPLTMPHSWQGPFQQPHHDLNPIVMKSPYPSHARSTLIPATLGMSLIIRQLVSNWNANPKLIHNTIPFVYKFLILKIQVPFLLSIDAIPLNIRINKLQMMKFWHPPNNENN